MNIDQTCLPEQLYSKQPSRAYHRRSLFFYAQLCQWLGLLLAHESLDTDFSFSSSAFTITIFSQHRAGTLGGLYRGQDGAKEK